MSKSFFLDMKLFCIVNIVAAVFFPKVFGHSNDYEDLSYSFSEDTIYFPGQRDFSLRKDYYGMRESIASWYSAYSFCMGEHGGTHLDSPFHFWKDGYTVEQIPAEHLIDIHGSVVDIEHKQQDLESRHVADAKTNDIKPNGDFVLTVDDLIKHESKYGSIVHGGLVFIHTGWSKYWGDKTLYLGWNNSTLNENENYTLSFPGISEEAIKWLYSERNIIGIGIDTASVDPGSSKAFPVHKYLARKQVYNLENVANLHLLVQRLVPRWTTISKTTTTMEDNEKKNCHYFNFFVLPLKIVSGTGSPTRILAQCKHHDTFQWNNGSRIVINNCFMSSYILIVLLMYYFRTFFH